MDIKGNYAGYNFSAYDISSYDENVEWLESSRRIRDCRCEIHQGLGRLRTDGAGFVRELRERYGEVAALIIAASVQAGRPLPGLYSREVLLWAEEFSFCDEGAPHYLQQFVIVCPAATLNALAEEWVRQEEAQWES